MPTIRQKLAVQKISDFIRNPNGLSINYGQILRESGYSQSTSEKPHLVLQSKTFQIMLNKAMGNQDLEVKIQHHLLINQFDNLSVKAKAIDMYYKLTARYKADDINTQQSEEISKALDVMASLVK